MPRSTIELKLADEFLRGGDQLVTAGESTRDVLNFGDGVALSDYFLVSVTLGGSPPLTVGEQTYTGTVDFGITFTAAGNARFADIRWSTFAAWAASILNSNGTPTIQILSVSWSGDVATVTIRVTAPVANSGATISGSSAFFNGTQSSGNPEPVTFTVSASGGGGSTSDFDLRLAWTPTGGGFESVRTYNWNVRWNQRAFTNADIVVQWFTNAADRNAGTNIILTGNSWTPGAAPPYPTSSLGTLPGESATAYARWRYVNAPNTWTSIDVTFSDPRPPL